MARASAQGAVAAGAAVAILQLLQQTIGAFNPRPWMQALVVVAVFFASLVVKRLATRRREQQAAEQLRRLLVVWPPRPLRDVDPDVLGCCPARRDLGPDRRYVKRAVDDALQAAIEAGAVALVHGPRLSGKTRTAHAAAARALGSAPVIAPRSAEALGELLAFDPPLAVGGERRVVWLDGLERYVEMLDAATLEDVRRLGEPARGSRDRRRLPAAPANVVATIRTEDWDELLAAGGGAGQGARAFAGAARAFEVPLKLAPGELAAARKRYPEATLDEGIGPALASTGRDATAPAPAAPARDEGPRPHALRDLQVAFPAAATLATLCVAALVWVSQGFSVPTIADQLSKIRREAGAGRHVIMPAGSGPIDLRGNNEDSYLMLFRDDPRGAPGTAGRASRSDELRVYDRDGDTLKGRPSLRFEPSIPAGSGPALFQFRGLKDIDGDSVAELVGGYARAGEGREALLPFALDYDAGRERYELVALDLPSPDLSRPKLARRFRIPARQYRALYREPVTFANRHGRGRLTGRRAQDFLVTEPNFRLVAGYFLRPPLDQNVDPALFELRAGILDRTGGRPRLRPCEIAGEPVTTESLLGLEAPWRAIGRQWDAVGTKRGCLLR